MSIRLATCPTMRSVSPPALPDALPRVVGRYELLRRVAVGGMAEIFEARALGMAGFARRVAVKRILPANAGNPEFVAMFLDEARLQAVLRHPNVAQVYDLGVDGDRVFYVMEFLDGLDGRQLRRALRERGERMALEQAIAIAMAAASALHSAHEATNLDGEPLGVVHRDVTPANLMVTVDGQVKLVDFGIASHMQRETRTEAGILKGKASYMSPEQILCRPLDRRSDLFSLGVVLYELSTGSRLFDRDSEHETMRQIALEDAPPPGARVDGYPAALEAVVLRALARDPAARFATAEEMRQALEQAADESGLPTAGDVGLARLVAELGTTPLDAPLGPSRRSADQPTRIRAIDPRALDPHTAVTARRSRPALRGVGAPRPGSLAGGSGPRGAGPLRPAALAAAVAVDDLTVPSFTAPWRSESP
jgi:eukaryotic-like serine/threonine-protein kinase